MEMWALWALIGYVFLLGVMVGYYVKPTETRVRVTVDDQVVLDLLRARLDRERLVLMPKGTEFLARRKT